VERRHAYFYSEVVIGEGPRFESSSAYLLHIQLRDIEPTVWRRLMVLGSLTLAKLHFVIQGAFGWEDFHLHSFEIHEVKYVAPDDDDDEDSETLDEAEWRVFQLLNVDDLFTYNYDFGDDWIHEVRVEGAENVSRTLKKSVCLDGARARPPEDVGGPTGFTHFLKVMNDPHHPEYVDAVQWHGERFNPERFSLFDINAQIQSRV
jgi:hypothetical protein